MNLIDYDKGMLEAIAAGLRTYPQKVSITSLTGVPGDSILTTAAMAAGFIEAYLRELPVPPGASQGANHESNATCFPSIHKTSPTDARSSEPK